MVKEYNVNFISVDKPRVLPMEDEDSSRVLKIYQESIENDDATYVTEVPAWEEWDASHDKKLRFVAKVEERVVAFVAVGRVFTSPAYRGVGEISIYVESKYRHMGIGTMLLEEVIRESEKLELEEQNGYYTLQARIFTNNIPSIALHKKVGFRFVGMREKILKKDGIWRDVYIYERRSKVL